MSGQLKTLRLLFKSVFVLVNLVVVALFIAAAFSDRISPEKNIMFSYLGLAFPVLCVLNFCFILYWLFLWEWRCILIGLVSFLICWTPISNYFPFHNRVEDVPKDNTIKVLTYNVMGFAYRNHTDEFPNPTVKYIADSGADIVCLQEFAVGSSEKYLTIKKLKKALSMYPYYSFTPISNSGVLKYGIALFSKYPILNSKRVDYKSKFNGSSIHELDIKGRKVTLINNHLESFKLTSQDKGRYSAFIKNLSSEAFDGMRGSLEQKLGTAFRLRSKQAEAVARTLKEVTSDYVIVCGDFNDTPVSYAHRVIQGPLKDAYSESGRGYGISYNENFFWFRIDNILYSSNMKSMNCTIDKVRYSDHYPMWCYLEFED